MEKCQPLSTLLPRQARIINATEGLRLEVRGGCLWLTRPCDSVDRFLVAGASIELRENDCVIQSDKMPGSANLTAAQYVLVPLAEAKADWHTIDAKRAILQSMEIVNQVLARLARNLGSMSGKNT